MAARLTGEVAIETPDKMTGDSAMAEHMPGDPGADGRFVRPDDGDMHVVQDGSSARRLSLLGGAFHPAGVTGRRPRYKRPPCR
jgi:hypothetical protein